MNAQSESVLTVSVESSLPRDVATLLEAARQVGETTGEALGEKTLETLRLQLQSLRWAIAGCETSVGKLERVFAK